MRPSPTPPCIGSIRWNAPYRPSVPASLRPPSQRPPHPSLYARHHRPAKPPRQPQHLRSDGFPQHAGNRASVRSVRVVVPFDVATVARAACTPDRRRPNRRAGPAARPATATGSGRRHQIWGAEPLQGEEAVRDRDQGHVVVPAGPAAPLEVVQPERAFELAVVL